MNNSETNSSMGSSPVALVTGASRGIGRSIALRLSKAGYRIGINYVKETAKAEEVLADIEKNGGEAQLHRADVSSLEEVRNMIMSFEQGWGPPEILVNNAGIYERASFEDVTPEKWERTIAVNLTGTYNCCQSVVPQMKKLGGGRIINLSSVLGFKGSKHGTHYATSKAGLLGFTKSLARELAPHNITVNAVAPGAIETDIVEGDSPETRRWREKVTPLGRV